MFLSSVPEYRNGLCLVGCKSRLQKSCPHIICFTGEEVRGALKILEELEELLYVGDGRIYDYNHTKHGTCGLSKCRYPVLVEGHLKMY